MQRRSEPVEVIAEEAVCSRADHVDDPGRLQERPPACLRTGETVDILLDITNPGRWMAHCHIAEHHESGMMLSFEVAPAGG